MTDKKTHAKNRNSIFQKMQTRGDALEIVRVTSIVMAIWIVAQAFVLIVVLHHPFIVDAIVVAVYVAVIFSIWRFKSRVGSILLLAFLVYALVFCMNRWPGASLMIVGIVGSSIWIAIRTVEATFKLHGRFALKV